MGTGRIRLSRTHKIWFPCIINGVYTHRRWCLGILMLLPFSLTLVHPCELKGERGYKLAIKLGYNTFRCCITRSLPYVKRCYV